MSVVLFEFKKFYEVLKSFIGMKIECKNRRYRVLIYGQGIQKHG